MAATNRKTQKEDKAKTRKLLMCSEYEVECEFAFPEGACKVYDEDFFEVCAACPENSENELLFEDTGEEEDMAGTISSGEKEDLVFEDTGEES